VNDIIQQPYAPPHSGLSEGVDHPGARPVPWTAADFRRLHRLFAWFHWPASLGFLAGIAALIVGMVHLFQQASQHRLGSEPMSEMLAWLLPGYVLMLIGGALGITAIVFAMIQLYRMWSVVQRPGGPTTPGKAVGFLFIPFYNFYWVFVAWPGLAREIDAALAAAGSQHRVGNGLATAYAVLFILSCVPYLGILALLPMLIVIPILLARLRDSVIRLLPATPDQPHA
jgi:hypothetical protein